MRTIARDTSGPTEVARISSDDRRLPSRSSYSLVYTWPTTITGAPLPNAAPTPVTNLPQQLTLMKSELPGSQPPSVVRRRELLATRNLMTSWVPTCRRSRLLTMWPTTVSGVSNMDSGSFPFAGSACVWRSFSPAAPTDPGDGEDPEAGLLRKVRLGINRRSRPDRERTSLRKFRRKFGVALRSVSRLSGA